MASGNGKGQIFVRGEVVKTVPEKDIVETLIEGGYEVVGEASNGEEAVALAKELKPDVIVMDIKMPIMDGITAAEHIAQDRLAPVVLLTPACASYDQYKDFEQRGEKFRALVAELPRDESSGAGAAA